jgi:L-lysine 2,3-aminomutase
MCKDCRKSRTKVFKKQKGREHFNTYSKLKRSERRKYVLDYLATHPCIDCGETDPIVLDFDHRDGEEKKGNVASFVGGVRAFDVLIAEMAKCDVRCANCHRRRTAKQQGWYEIVKRLS